MENTEGLTAGKLITYLQQFPPDLPVWAEGYDQYCLPVDKCEVTTLRGANNEVLILRTCDDPVEDLY